MQIYTEIPFYNKLGALANLESNSILIQLKNFGTGTLITIVLVPAAVLQ